MNAAAAATAGPKLELAPSAPAEDPGNAQMAAEMLHNLTLIRHFADEAQSKLCLSQEASVEAGRQERVNKIVHPSATAASRLLIAKGKGVDPRTIAASVGGDGGAEAIRQHAQVYDAQAKACLRGIMEHCRRLGAVLGLDVAITEKKTS